jgi:hypothetical protein
MWWIRRAILRALADEARTIRIPSHTSESIGKLSRLARRLDLDWAARQWMDELAAVLTTDQIRAMRRFGQAPVSLETHVAVTATDGLATGAKTLAHSIRSRLLPSQRFPRALAPVGAALPRRSIGGTGPNHHVLPYRYRSYTSLRRQQRARGVTQYQNPVDRSPCIWIPLRPGADRPLRTSPRRSLPTLAGRQRP